MNDPLVSVVIPTFNRKALLVRALESVFGQSYQNVEVVVVDDCSADDTQEHVASLFANEISSGRLRVIRSPRNQGNAQSKNNGISNAKGELIAFLDDDDVWLPEKLAEQVRALASKGADACFCATRWVENGVVLKETLVRNAKISFENGGPTSTWLIKKSVFNKLGLFDMKVPTNDEGEFLVRFNKAGFTSSFVDLPLYVHYYVESTISHSREGKMKGFEYILSKHRGGLNRAELSSLYSKIAVLDLLSGKKNFQLVFKSIALSPSATNFFLFVTMLLPKKLAILSLNKALDFMHYPRSFAERYAK